MKTLHADVLNAIFENMFHQKKNEEKKQLTYAKWRHTSVLSQKLEHA